MQTARPVHEIARMVGFPDESYFSRRFHRELSLSPLAYRRVHQVRRASP
jgi:AraC family transcriptional regulator